MTLEDYPGWRSWLPFSCSWMRNASSSRVSSTQVLKSNKKNQTKHPVLLQGNGVFDEAGEE
jgi:hypothetical protein